MELEAIKKSYVDGALAAMTEFSAVIAELERERDAYRNELIETLRKATVCVEGEEVDCNGCPYYGLTNSKGCPSKLSPYAAKLRLEELLND